MDVNLDDSTACVSVGQGEGDGQPDPGGNGLPVDTTGLEAPLFLRGERVVLENALGFRLSCEIHDPAGHGLGVLRLDCIPWLE